MAENHDTTEGECPSHRFSQEVPKHSSYGRSAATIITEVNDTSTEIGWKKFLTEDAQLLQR